MSIKHNQGQKLELAEEIARSQVEAAKRVLSESYDISEVPAEAVATMALVIATNFAALYNR